MRRVTISSAYLRARAASGSERLSGGDMTAPRWGPRGSGNLLFGAASGSEVEDSRRHARHQTVDSLWTATASERADDARDAAACCDASARRRRLPRRPRRCWPARARAQRLFGCPSRRRAPRGRGGRPCAIGAQRCCAPPRRHRCCTWRTTLRALARVLISPRFVKTQQRPQLWPQRRRWGRRRRGCSGSSVTWVHRGASDCCLLFVELARSAQTLGDPGGSSTLHRPLLLRRQRRRRG